MVFCACPLAAWLLATLDTRLATTTTLPGVPRGPSEVSSHASFCETCGPLLLDCEENDRVLGLLLPGGLDAGGEFRCQRDSSFRP